MSYKEWNAGILLAASLLISAWVAWDAIVGGTFTAPVSHLAQTLLYAILISIGFNIVAVIVVTIIVSIVRREEFRDERADERDKAVTARAMRNAYLALSIGGAVTLAVLAWGPGGTIPIYVLFAALMIGSATDSASRLYYYHVGCAPMGKGTPQIDNNIRLLRFGRDMTQAELAALVGVTRQTIVAIEQNKYSPSLEVAFRIAQVFKLPLTEVFEYRPATE